MASNIGIFVDKCLNKEDEKIGFQGCLKLLCCDRSGKATTCCTLSIMSWMPAKWMSVAGGSSCRVVVRERVLASWECRPSSRCSITLARSSQWKSHTYHRGDARWHFQGWILQGGPLFLPPPKKQSHRHGGVEFLDSVFFSRSFLPHVWASVFLGGGKNSCPPCTLRPYLAEPLGPGELGLPVVEPPQTQP